MKDMLGAPYRNLSMSLLALGLHIVEDKWINIICLELQYSLGSGRVIDEVLLYDKRTKDMFGCTGT